MIQRILNNKSTLGWFVATVVLLFNTGCTAMRSPSDAQTAAARRVAVVVVGHDVLIQTDSRNKLFSPAHVENDIAPWKLDRYLTNRFEEVLVGRGRAVVSNVKFDEEKFKEIYSSKRRTTLSVSSGIWPMKMRDEIRRIGKEHDLDAVVFVYAAQSNSDGRVDPMGANIWTSGFLSAKSRLWLVTRIKVFGTRSEEWISNGLLSPGNEGMRPLFLQARIPVELGQLPFEKWSAGARENARAALISLIDESVKPTVQALFGTS